MFKIRYLITSPDIWRKDPQDNNDTDPLTESISGMIELSFDGNTIGYFNEAIAEPSWGNEWLDLWFKFLLSCLIYLESKGYAVIYDFETSDQATEFRKVNNQTVIVSRIIRNHVGTAWANGWVFNEPIPDSKPGKWSDLEVEYTQLKEEITNIARQFVEEVCKRNPLYRENENLLEIKQLLDEVENRS